MQTSTIVQQTSSQARFLSVLLQLKTLFRACYMQYMPAYRKKISFCLWVLLSSLSEAWNNKLRYLTCSASFTHLPLGETAGVAGCLYCLGGSCTDYLITIENNFVISSITTTNIPKTKKTFDAGTKHPYIIENSICDSQTYFPQYISLWLWPVYWVISDLSEPGLIQHHERL